MTSAILALRDVRRRQGGRDVLVVPVLDVLAGEVLVVIGPNGAGKSTLLRVLGLLERPDAGEVLVGGRAVDARTADDSELIAEHARWARARLTARTEPRA